MEVSKEVSEFADQLSDFRAKAEQGDAEAQYNLGRAYDSESIDRGVPKNK